MLIITFAFSCYYYTTELSLSIYLYAIALGLPTKCDMKHCLTNAKLRHIVAFYGLQNTPKCVGPRWGAHDAPPQCPPSPLVGGYISLYPDRLGEYIWGIVPIFSIEPGQILCNPTFVSVTARINGGNCKIGHE